MKLFIVSTTLLGVLLATAKFARPSRDAHMSGRLDVQRLKKRTYPNWYIWKE